VPLSSLPTAPPPDRKLAYPWVAAEWLQDEYRVARNRDQIERPEDFEYGWRVRTQLGYADGAFGADRSSVLFDSRVSRGLEVGARQTWLFAAALAGRYEDGELTDTILTGSARWYLRQSERRLLYAALGFDAGHNLDADRQILIGGDTGLRGYPLRYQGGEGRWLFTLEQRAFSNWYPFRLVNVGAAAFVDVGGAWGDNPFGTRSQGVLSDVGVGLRLGNSRSGLGNVLHLDLAFPLNGDSSIKNVQFLVETKRSF
jgi:hemolysin activation/secretion protein